MTCIYVHCIHVFVRARARTLTLLLHGVNAVEKLNKESKFPPITNRGAAKAPHAPRSQWYTRLGIVLWPNEGQLWC